MRYDRRAKRDYYVTVTVATDDAACRWVVLVGKTDLTRGEALEAIRLHPGRARAMRRRPYLPELVLDNYRGD